MLTLTLSNQYLLTYTCIYTLNVLCVHTDQHNKFAYPSYLLFSVIVIKINMINLPYNMLLFYIGVH